MLLPHFAFPPQAPHVTSIAAVFDARSIALSVGNKGKLANGTQRDEHDAMSTTTMRRMAMRRPAAWTIASRTR